jgi:hypothetical protein
VVDQRWRDGHLPHPAMAVSRASTTIAFDVLGGSPADLTTCSAAGR